jgi:hypothetical protein
VNGQLGHGDETDLYEPKVLEALSQGRLTRASIMATATALGGYVAPADRYAVVPDEGGKGAGAAGGSGGGEEQQEGNGVEPLTKKARWEGAAEYVAVPDN